MKKVRKKKIRYDRVFIFVLGVILISFLCFFILLKTFNFVKDIFVSENFYVRGSSSSVEVYTDSVTLTKDNIPRGIEIKTLSEVDINDLKYYKIIYNKKVFYISEDNLTKNKDDIVKESVMYVRTPVTLYENSDSIKIKSQVEKGEKLQIIGYDELLSDGSVNMYKVKYNDLEGYVYAKYLVNNYEDAIIMFNEVYSYHESRGDTLGGGSAANLDYYPYEKPNFTDNVMPDEVRALYVNSGVVNKIDEYIKIAKESNINAFVVDIKDNTSPAYPAKSMEVYSPTNYNKAINSYETYKKAIKKLKDEGFYVIGRITVFKDSYYAKDHPEDTILDTTTNESYNHDGSFWPSAYKRNVWEFNVSLAVESVKEMGFNEIQFDYVRFPDRVRTLEKDGLISYGNTYNEEKAQAIQRFVMYACDEVHKVGAYVSIDVFGEAAHNYVTAYGQYFPAISNIADVISPMPYPDHFSKYEYEFTSVVWTVPYKLLNFWATNYVVKRQNEIKTPAKVRNWIQAYDTNKSPKTSYDSYMVSEEIKALYDAGLRSGYMTWNGSSSLSKYSELSDAFKKEY